MSSSKAASASYLPSNWNDDVRMNAMFLDFRHRSVNPSDWDAKLNFWRYHILEWSRVSNKTTFSPEHIRRSFSRNGRIPRGLDTVTSEMVKDGQLMTISSYLEFTSEPGWMSWSFDILIRKPLSYSWSYLKTFWAAQEKTNQEFVNVELVKEKSSLINQRHEQLVKMGDENPTVTLDALAEQCKDICGSSKDLELCLLWLRKERKLVMYNDRQHKIIKFFHDGDKKVQQHLSETDKALVQLKTARKSLMHQIEGHEAEIEKYKTEAKMHLKLGDRTMAKVALQKKKQAEKVLSKKDITLENIENLLHRLQDVDSQKAVLDALRAGSDAFKLQQDFDIDKVDETMAAVQETLDVQLELQETLGRTLQSDYDMSELETELEDILARDDDREPSPEVEKERQPIPAREEQTIPDLPPEILAQAGDGERVKPAKEKAQLEL